MQGMRRIENASDSHKLMQIGGTVIFFYSLIFVSAFFNTEFCTAMTMNVTGLLEIRFIELF